MQDLTLRLSLLKNKNTCSEEPKPVNILQLLKISHYYEGRSINKLQNGAIPLILKIGKIRNIRFVGNLILKIHRNVLTMTSLL